VTSSTPTAPTSLRTNSEESSLSFTRPARTRFQFSGSEHTTVVERALASPSSTTPTRPLRNSNLTTVSSVSEPPLRLRRPADSNVCVPQIPSFLLHCPSCTFILFYISPFSFVRCVTPVNEMVVWDKRNSSHTIHTQHR
jgi:hypothetical protein